MSSPYLVLPFLKTFGGGHVCNYTVLSEVSFQQIKEWLGTHFGT